MSMKSVHKGDGIWGYRPITKMNLLEQNYCKKNSVPEGRLLWKLTI